MQTITKTSNDIQNAFTGLIDSFNNAIEQIPDEIKSIDFLHIMGQEADQNASTLNLQGLEDTQINSSSVKDMVLKNIKQHLLEAQEVQTSTERDISLVEISSSNTSSTNSEKQACEKFHESEMEEFYRINKLFNPDDATCLVKPSDLSKSDALYWYGIIMQGSYGDNKSVAPSWFSLVDRLKWNSYENQKGTNKHEARVTFIKGAKEMLTVRGFSSENPLKKQIDLDFSACVQKKLNSGLSQAEIDSESNNLTKKIEQLNQNEAASVPINLRGFEYDDSLFNNFAIQHNSQGNGSSIITYSLLSSAIVLASQQLI